MNPWIQLKTSTPLFLVALLLACFAMPQTAPAVVPAPDGGYPGGNTAEGQNALFSLTTGGFNTAVGWLALRSNTENGFNTAVGAGALLANISAANTATGAGALLSTTTGGNNTANGMLALLNNTIGTNNTACGSGSLLSNTEGYNNTASGFHALFTSTISSANTAIGESALFINSTGGQNTAVGSGALQNNTTGNGNAALGIAAGSQITTANSVICIGTPGADVGNSCFIGRIWNQPGGSQAVYVNSDGKLGAVVSSRRFKEEIKPMEQASEVIYDLQPVSFRYTSEIEPTRLVGFGLIAEDVEDLDSNLVICGSDGRAMSVRYDAVNAMLLNEFLKEHHKVEAQEATMMELKSAVAQQEKGMELLTAQLKEQAAQIQKVNAQVEMSKPAPQVARTGGFHAVHGERSELASQ
jgi:hypothetical protein